MNIKLTMHELDRLVNYHRAKADYALACKQTQVDIARREPLYTTKTCGGFYTVNDWLQSSEKWEAVRKYHRGRQRIMKKLYLETKDTI